MKHRRVGQRGEREERGLVGNGGLVERRQRGAQLGQRSARPGKKG